MTLDRPPSDLQRAAQMYEQGVQILATHPGPIGVRLQQAALTHFVNAGPWTRPRLPLDMPPFMQPAHDVPDDLIERIRVVGMELTTVFPLPDLRAVELADSVVALAADLRTRLTSQRRRAVENLGMAVTREQMLAPPTDEALLTSLVWGEEHLLVLGRIIELSAENESTVRHLLGRALGLAESGFQSRRYVDAVFLGSRVNDLKGRLVNLAALEGVPEWMPVAVAWARRAANADERRNKLVHRPPVIVMGGAGPLPGMSAARRDQATEVITTQAWDLLRELEAVRRDGFDVLQVSAPT